MRSTSFWRAGVSLQIKTSNEDRATDSTYVKLYVTPSGTDGKTHGEVEALMGKSRDVRPPKGRRFHEPGPAQLSLGSRSAVLPGSARAAPWRQSRLGGGAACRRGRRQSLPARAAEAVHGEVIANDALHFN
ncbi:hypothetical protein EVAR_100840_1 [Eumeta japonica]|uniref:Uncharacterized protein n=1 Tax=Eumeta variegata TaxID=151549 RepID=A0A4C2A7R8_EUMVA|nr:hypothetical protein EVAR_100840_1 [Eumeta japonica]